MSVLWWFIDPNPRLENRFTDLTMVVHVVFRTLIFG